MEDLVASFKYQCSRLLASRGVVARRLTKCCGLGEARIEGVGIIKHLVVPTQLQCCRPSPLRTLVRPDLPKSYTIQQTPCSCSVIGPSYSTHLYTSPSVALSQHRFLQRQPAYLTSFSSISLASLTLVARYGEPPRSGWLRSMSDRCFLRRRSFVTPRSLGMSACRLSHLVQALDIRHLENQGGLSPCHLGLKAALVETAPQRGATNAVLAYRDERSAALMMLAFVIGRWWVHVRRRLLRPGRGPIAR